MRSRSSGSRTIALSSGRGTSCTAWSRPASPPSTPPLRHHRYRPGRFLFTSGRRAPPGARAEPRQSAHEPHPACGRSTTARRSSCSIPLPMFHSFGLTGGLVLRLLSGVRIFLYVAAALPDHSRAGIDIGAIGCSAPTRSSPAMRGPPTPTIFTRCAMFLPEPSRSARRRGGPGRADR